MNKLMGYWFFPTNWTFVALPKNASICGKYFCLEVHQAYHVHREILFHPRLKCSSNPKNATDETAIVAEAAISICSSFTLWISWFKNICRVMGIINKSIHVYRVIHLARIQPWLMETFISCWSKDIYIWNPLTRNLSHVLRTLCTFRDTTGEIVYYSKIILLMGKLVPLAEERIRSWRAKRWKGKKGQVMGSIISKYEVESWKLLWNLVALTRPWFDFL